MKKSVFALPALLLLSGCQTYQSQQNMRTRQSEDQLIQQENQRRMSGRIETLEMEIAQISRELDQLRQTLDHRYESLERKTEENKRETVARLTAQLEKLLAKSAPVAPRPSSRNSGNTHGYEHTVQPGETLSAIAKAYNVSTKAIRSGLIVKPTKRDYTPSEDG